MRPQPAADLDEKLDRLPDCIARDRFLLVKWWQSNAHPVERLSGEAIMPDGIVTLTVAKGLVLTASFLHLGDRGPSSMATTSIQRRDLLDVAVLPGPGPFTQDMLYAMLGEMD